MVRIPSPTVRRNPSWSPAALNRDSAGNSTAAMATAKMPCGSM